MPGAPCSAFTLAYVCQAKSITDVLWLIAPAVRRRLSRAAVCRWEERSPRHSGRACSAPGLAAFSRMVA